MDLAKIWHTHMAIRRRHPLKKEFLKILPLMELNRGLKFVRNLVVREKYREPQIRYSYVHR